MTNWPIFEEKKKTTIFFLFILLLFLLHFISFTNLMFSIAFQMSFVVCFTFLCFVQIYIYKKKKTKHNEIRTKPFYIVVAHCLRISQVVKLIANAKKLVLIMAYLECGTHVRPTPK